MSSIPPLPSKGTVCSGEGGSRNLQLLPRKGRTIPLVSSPWCRCCLVPWRMLPSAALRWLGFVDRGKWLLLPLPPPPHCWHPRAPGALCLWGKTKPECLWQLAAPGACACCSGSSLVKKRQRKQVFEGKRHHRRELTDPSLPHVSLVEVYKAQPEPGVTSPARSGQNSGCGSLETWAPS